MAQNIKVIQNKGQAALVEWFDLSGLHRAIVPAALLVQGQLFQNVSEEALAEGIEFGAPWQEYLELIVIDSAAIVQALHAHGVWTLEDYMTKQDLVHNAVSSLAMGPIMQALAKAASALKALEAEHRV